MGVILSQVEGKYIYLDFNVFQLIKNGVSPRGRDSFNTDELAHCIKKISSEYLFPISEAHLLDLSNSDPAYFTKDLIFLIRISHGFCMAFDNESFDNKSEPIRCPKEIFSLFEKIKKKPKNNKKIFFKGGWDFNVDMQKIKKTDIFYPYLSKNDGVMNEILMNDFLNDCLKNSNNYAWYKQFRASIENLRKIDESSPLFNNKKLYDELELFSKFITSSKPYDFYDKMSLVMDSFYSAFGNNIFSSLSLNEKIKIMYHIIDYNTFFSEKISKKNKPENMFIDSQHLISAANSCYFVTNDKNSYHKSKFVCKALGLKTKLLLPQEFISNFR